MNTQTFGDSTLGGVCSSYEPDYIYSKDPQLDENERPIPIDQEAYTGRISLLNLFCLPLAACWFPCHLCLGGEEACDEGPCDDRNTYTNRSNYTNLNGGDERIHFSPGYLPLVYLSRITCLPFIFLELFYPFAFAPSPGKHERFAPHRNEACLDYRKNRENGDTCDDPSRPFPNDGKYAWATPREGRSKVRYTEGPGDKAWMEEKDKNYLARLERENVNSEETQLKLSI